MKKNNIKITNIGAIILLIHVLCVLIAISLNNFMPNLEQNKHFAIVLFTFASGIIFIVILEKLGIGRKHFR